MSDRIIKWEPIIVGICAPLIVALLLSTVGLLWKNTTQISKNTDKLLEVVNVQPNMTDKLNNITVMLGELQTKKDAHEVHERLRDDINDLDKRVTILENN